jgi:diguanylate cyclase
MIFDLRSVPVFIAAYMFGWRKGLFTTLFPSLYRWYLGGPTALAGIEIDLLLPVVIGSLAYKLREEKGLFAQLEVKGILSSFLAFSVLRSALQLLVLDISVQFWLNLTIVTTVFSLGAVAVIVFMIKDFRRNLLERKELELQANFDQMTNLYNLSYFKVQTKQLLEQEENIIIIMIDIDYFKNYNDTYGHPAGDKILIQIANILKDNVRNQDIIGRYGGEEFIASIPGLKKEQKAVTVAERIRQAVEDFNFKGAKDSQPGGKMTISLGISSLSSTKELEELIEEADEALYKAKTTGRNKTKLYSNLD